MFNIARPSGKYDGQEGRPAIDSIIDRLKQGHTSLGNVALTDCLRSTIAAPQGWMVATTICQTRNTVLPVDGW